MPPSDLASFVIDRFNKFLGPDLIVPATIALWFGPGVSQHAVGSFRMQEQLARAKPAPQKVQLTTTATGL